MGNDLISRSALLEAGSAIKINEAIEGWNELPSNAKAACIRLARENKKLVMAAPAVDAVEVVRCKDCKYCRSFKGLGAWCHRRFRADIEYKVKSCDFCSFGKRRADDGEQSAAESQTQES